MVFCTTPRLTLRNFRPDDLDAFVALIVDKMAQPESAYDDRFPTDRDTLERILSVFSEGNSFIALCLQDTPIGYVALLPAEDHTFSLAFCLKSDKRGQGYAREGIRALLKRTFSDPSVRCIRAEAASANTSSLRLLDTLGFQPTGEREAIFYCDEAGNPVTGPARSFELARSMLR